MSYFLACLLTVLIETAVFHAAGYRRHEDLTIIVCANIVTNLTLNLALARFCPQRGPVEYALEAAVTALEFGIYSLAFGPSGRLLLLTLGANALSYGLGLLL